MIRTLLLLTMSLALAALHGGCDQASAPPQGPTVAPPAAPPSPPGPPPASPTTPSATAPAAPAADQPAAPQAAHFTLPDLEGKPHRLADYRGRFVVLEWTNHGCPYVKKHYGCGNMQRLQQTWTAKGAAWLTICSSAPGTQGHMSAAEWQETNSRLKAQPTAVLLDPDGQVGHSYNAKTTPHMYVVDPQGRLIYQGGIDDKPTTDQADVANATNYVDLVLGAAMAGEKVPVDHTPPYGCSVKYAR